MGQCTQFAPTPTTTTCTHTTHTLPPSHPLCSKVFNYSQWALSQPCQWDSSYSGTSQQGQGANFPGPTFTGAQICGCVRGGGRGVMKKKHLHKAVKSWYSPNPAKRNPSVTVSIPCVWGCGREADAHCTKQYRENFRNQIPHTRDTESFSMCG